MKLEQIVGLAALVLIPGVLACDPPANRDDREGAARSAGERTGQTTTTGASNEAARKADALGEKLDRAGETAGEVAKKAAVDAKQEAKKEWNELDVHVETNGKGSARDGGVTLKTR